MNTKALRQKILDLAIRGKLVPQNPNDEPASVLLDRIRAEKERLIKEGRIKRSKKNATSDVPHYEQDVPFEVPENWCWTTVEEICSKIGSGSTPRGSNYSEKGIPFFRSQNVYNEGLVYDDIKYISAEVHKSMSGTEVIANDVLLNITGGSLGRCAVVPEDFRIGNVSQHVCILRTVLVESKYLQYLILSSHFAKTMKVSGSGREGLPKYSIEAMLFPLPPLAEQKRIVNEVEKWMEVIGEVEVGKTNIEQLIAQAKSKILDLAIKGKLVEQDENDEPANELLKRINPSWQPSDTSHYENVPKGWVNVCLSECCEMYQPHTIALSEMEEDGKYPVYGANGIIGHYNNYNHREPVVLLTCRGATCGESRITSGKCWINGNAMVIKPNELLSNKYLLYFLRLKGKSGNVITGTAQPQITRTNLSKLFIAVPPKKEQNRIVAKIEELFATLDSISQALTD